MCADQFSLMFLKIAVHRNNFLRHIQSSNNIWGNLTCIWRKRWMETLAQLPNTGVWAHGPSANSTYQQCQWQHQDTASHDWYIFGLNRPNYARWGVLFLNQLAKGAPQSQAVLQSGAFSMERSFSQSAIDLVLEQTVNRDAASQVRGIIRVLLLTTRNNSAASDALTGEQKRERRLPKGCVVQCSHRIVWPLLMSSINICLPLEHCYRNSSISWNSGVFDGEPCLLPQTSCKVSRGMRSRWIKINEAHPKKRGVHLRTEKFKEEASHSQLKTCCCESQMYFHSHTCHPFKQHDLQIRAQDRKLLNKLDELQDGFTETLPLIDVTLIDGGQLIHSFLSATGKITSYGNLARTLLHICVAEEAMRFTYCLIPIIQCPWRREREIRGADDLPFLITGLSEVAPKRDLQG